VKHWLTVVGEKPATAEVKGDVLQGMKNKTMEEIINKWTGELDRCSEQFKTQSNDIRRWDAILVENGDKVANPIICLILDFQVIHSNMGSFTSPRPCRHSINLY
jgi:hypothetical protein